MNHQINLSSNFPVPDGSTMILGVSGGCDSIAMLHLLHHSDRLFQLYVCHLNHCLRGEESARDEFFVTQLCKQWDIPCFVKKVDIQALAQQNKIGIEACARQQRYLFFDQTVKQLKQDASPIWVATGHTRSDHIETILFRLSRGTGLHGLTGIPMQRNHIVRPLHHVSRSEVKQYCQLHQLSYMDDSSNASDDYARNRIRHHVIPQLKKIHPTLEHNLATTALLLQDEENFLDLYSKQLQLEWTEKNHLKTIPLKQQHPAIQRRVLRHFLKEQGITLSRDTTLLAQQLLQHGGKMSMDANHFLVVTTNNIFITTPPTFQYLEEQPLEPGCFQSLTKKTYKVQSLCLSNSIEFYKILKNPFDLFLDCGKIKGSILLRLRKPGDKIKLPHQVHRKTFKQLFQQHQTPIELRRQLFVLQDDQGVIALEQFGVDQRVDCTEQTKKIMMITAMDPLKIDL